ncbi:MAG: glucose-1-phosphate adenylyltransferase [Gammaproteobacteria bacterium]
MHFDSSHRYVSRLTRRTIALILAGGRGSRLKNLTEWRAKPAVPFGGKFRIIDFPLSNCVNSGIRQISVLTQYKAHSLIRHIQKGWSFFRGEFGEFVELLPAQQRLETSWYAGTADAVFQNLDIIRSSHPDYILILAGDHIYKMDYGTMLTHHLENDADVTIGCIEVSKEQAKEYGVMAIKEDTKIVSFDEKPENPAPMPGNEEFSLASMGIYIFNTNFLIEQVIRDADTADSNHDFGKDIIPYAVYNNYHVYAFPFRNPATQKSIFWRDVGTIDSYYDANIELVNITPELNLYDSKWPIWTYQEQLPPAKFIFSDKDCSGYALDSMVSGGCIISGAKVFGSLLFSNVYIEKHSLVKDCIVLPNVRIGKNCKLRNIILEKYCEIPDGTEIGYNQKEDSKKYYISPKGRILVTPEMLGQEVHHAR